MTGFVSNWATADSSYVWYDNNANILHFKDGTFWVMGCTSGGQEPDAGTMYPTVIEDPNGNQIIITYAAGNGVAGPNSSSRIATIEDVRGKGSATYTFTWNNGVLASISNSVGTSETYTFGMTGVSQLTPPFGADGNNWGPANMLTSIGLPTGASWGFTYDPSGSGEMTQATFPDGGHIRWTYLTMNYSGTGRSIREVGTRYVLGAIGGTEWGPYTLTHNDSQNPNPSIHANATLADASGVGARTWNFNLPQGNAWDGLASEYLQTSSAGGAVMSDATYTWATDANGNPYIGTSQTALDEGSSNPQTSKTVQTLDGYGNVTQRQVFDYNSLSTAVRTYNYTYLHTSHSNYDNAYIRNRMLTSSVTDNANHTTTLATNTYDGGTLSAVSPAPTEFDATQGATTNHVRGLVTQTASMGLTANYTYDQTGQSTSGANASGTGASMTFSSATNNAAPDSVAPIAGTADVQNGHSVTQASGSQLTTDYGYNTALSLTSSVMPNSATTGQTFSSSTGLVTSSVSVHGATTNYTYAFAPTIVTATTNSHWQKSYKDGFGRESANESGFGSTVVSHTDNKYGPCACSPLGKVTAVSQPYALNGGVVTATDGTSNIAWTSYVYDGLGRTLTQTAPDNSATVYYYLGNTTKITDPAGNWKRYTSDVFGNLKEVEEPNPAYGQADNTSTNFVTTYAYDVESHLTGVSMPRPYGGSAYTQTRSFGYDLPTGRLLSATNPENGTVSYSYYSDGRLMSKNDAKGQKVVYSYDGYGRLAYIDRYPNGQTWDYCHSVSLTYDSSQSGSNLLGRIAGATTGYASDCSTTMSENYSYTSGGLPTVKDYLINVQGYTECGGYCVFAAYSYGPTASFTYDNEGHMTGYNTLSYTLDSAGRPVSLTETGPGTVWAQNATYGPGGEMKSIQYRASSGSYYTEMRTYNNRAQAIEVASSGSGLPATDFKYNYTGGANNGQIAQMNDAISGEQVTYQYDSLKRLIQAQTTGSGWGQSFGYDGWGNLLSKNPTSGHTGTSMSLNVNPANNQVTTSGFAYDANGNTTSIPSTPQNIALTYDVENRTGGTWYDQQNQPLDRAGVWNLYGLGGERLATYTYSQTQQTIQESGYVLWVTYPTLTLATRNIYFWGRLIQSNGTTVLTDRLGSVRMTEAGTASEYLPYGEEVASTSNDREKFGTYTRESSTGLDYANQRYYAPVYGRFTSPDRYTASAGPKDTRSWNRYSYTRGDPINRFDPSGRIDCPTYYDLLVESGESGPGAGSLGNCSANITDGSVSLDPCTVSDPAALGFLGISYPDPACEEAAGSANDNSHENLPDHCHLEVRYSQVVIGAVATGRNHTELVGIDDTTNQTLGVIDGHAAWGSTLIGNAVVPALLLTPVVSVNGIYNNANISTPYVDSRSSAQMCDGWNSLEGFAETFPIKALYGGLVSNSNTLTSYLWQVAGFAAVGPPPGPNSTPGWNGGFAIVP